MRQRSTSASFGVCFSDPSGRLVMSNAAHAARLKSVPAAVIGRSWREWTPPTELNSSERAFQACLAGRSFGLMRTAMLPDGTVARSHLLMLPVSLKHGSGVIGVHRTASISLDKAQARLSSAEVAEFIERTTEHLIKLSAASGSADILAGLGDVRQRAHAALSSPDRI